MKAIIRREILNYLKRPLFWIALVVVIFGVFQQLKDKTVMVIAHRMRTVANADKIVVLDDGKVSETGTPEELLQKGGLYARLVSLQNGQ